MKKRTAQIFRKKKGREIQKQNTRQREEIKNNRRRDFNQMTIFTSKVTLIIIPKQATTTLPSTPRERDLPSMAMAVK